MDNVLLVGLGLCASIFLAGWFVWRFVFKRSLRKVIMASLGLWMERDGRAEDQPITPSTAPESSDVLFDQADAAKTQPLQAIDVQEDRPNTTSQAGWPQSIQQPIRRLRRPFRLIRLQTDAEHPTRPPSTD